MPRTKCFLVLALIEVAAAARIRHDAVANKTVVKEDMDIFRRCSNRIPKAILGFGTEDAEKKCMACAVADGCEWCPLTQRCESSGVLGNAVGFGCSTRDTPEFHQQDRSCRHVADCGDRSSSFSVIMESMYGANWQDGDTHIDAVRCLQWALDWDVTEDDNMKGADGDAVGRWGCFSALVRDGILAAMGEQSMPLARKQGGRGLLKNSTTWKPLLCDVVEMKADTNDCYVRGFSLEQFKRLRRRSDSPNGQGPDVNIELSKSIRSGPLISFSPGAGKSGSGFSKTTDQHFCIKLGLKYSAKMNEPDNLISMVEGVTREGKKFETLSEHFENNPKSLLNRYYGLFKAAFGETRPYVLVMADAFYEVDQEASYQKKHGSFLTYHRYDLKGESRNQFEMKHKGFTLINGDFRDREHNRVWLSDEQCLEFRAQVATDGHFLSAYGIIDYSLLALAVRHPEGARDVTCDGTPGAPFCMANTEYLYTLSIIDYLNNFNWFKKTESAIKGGKFSEYELQMLTFAEKICRTTDEVTTHERIMGMLLQQYDNIRAAFDAVDKDEDGWIFPEDMQTLFADINLTGDEARLLFECIDPDESGHVNFKEFVRIWDSSGAPHC